MPGADIKTILAGIAARRGERTGSTNWRNMYRSPAAGIAGQGGGRGGYVPRAMPTRAAAPNYGNYFAGMGSYGQGPGQILYTPPPRPAPVVSTPVNDGMNGLNPNYWTPASLGGDPNRLVGPGGFLYGAGSSGDPGSPDGTGSASGAAAAAAAAAAADAGVGSSSGEARRGGLIRGLAGGGYVDGPGDDRPTLDDLLSNPGTRRALTPGMKADEADIDAVRRALPYLSPEDRAVVEQSLSRRQGLKRMAAGGRVDGADVHGRAFEQGLIDKPTDGRADNHTATLRINSYVIPADVVSALGDGNTMAGGKKLDELCARTPDAGMARGGIAGDRRTKVKISGGEYVVKPEKVAALGRGDPRQGAMMLDREVDMIRKHASAKMAKMPGPMR